MKVFRNELNGGYLDYNHVIDFVNIKLPNKLTAIKRLLGDFLDHSVLPDTKLQVDEITNGLYLLKDSIIKHTSMSQEVKLPTYKFALG